MGKGKDAKKAVKKEPTKTPKERKAEKRLKKAKKEQLYFSLRQLRLLILREQFYGYVSPYSSPKGFP